MKPHDFPKSLSAILFGILAASSASAAHLDPLQARPIDQLRGEWVKSSPNGNNLCSADVNCTDDSHCAVQLTTQSGSLKVYGSIEKNGTEEFKITSSTQDSSRTLLGPKTLLQDATLSLGAGGAYDVVVSRKYLGLPFTHDSRDQVVFCQGMSKKFFEVSTSPYLTAPTDAYNLALIRCGDQSGFGAGSSAYLSTGLVENSDAPLVSFSLTNSTTRPPVMEPVTDTLSFATTVELRGSSLHIFDLPNRTNLHGVIDLSRMAHDSLGYPVYEMQVEYHPYGSTEMRSATLSKCYLSTTPEEVERIVRDRAVFWPPTSNLSVTGN